MTIISAGKELTGRMPLYSKYTCIFPSMFNELQLLSSRGKQNDLIACRNNNIFCWVPIQRKVTGVVILGNGPTDFTFFIHYLKNAPAICQRHQISSMIPANSSPTCCEI